MSELRVVPGDLVPPRRERRHLLSVEDLTRDDVERLLATARSFAVSQERETKKLPTLRGRLVINLFYESSTRTSSSFELAAKRLSADTLNVKSAGSSVDKGESLKDTTLTLSSYDPDVIVVRHPEAGAANVVASNTRARVVNAGDGKHQHPTQALLDLYTLREAFGRLDGLHVAIVGDVAHSRVARSLVQALRLVGSDAILVGPPTLVPTGLAPVSHDIASIADADVIYVLRMQKRAHAPRRELRAVAARVHGAVGDHARARRRRPARDAPRPDEPRRRARSAGRRLAGVARSSTRSAPGSSCAWRCSTTCSPQARSPSRPPWGSRDAAPGPVGQREHRRARRAHPRPARAGRRDPRRAHRRRRDRTDRRAARHERASRRRGGRARRSSRRSSTRTCICARPGARTRRRSPPGRQPPRPAATARSSRCRTPSRSSTTRRRSAACARARRPRRTSRSASSPRSRRGRRARSSPSSGRSPTPARSGSPTTAARS